MVVGLQRLIAKKQLIVTGFSIDLEGVDGNFDPLEIY